jgi:hypothetical protein
MIGSLPDDMFCVGYFASASSDRRVPNESAERYGGIVADLGCSASTGGGDQHLMWAFPKGYRQHGGKYLAVFSTPGLVIKETRNGFLPPAEKARIVRSIGTRIWPHLLQTPHMFASWEGGNGTGEENGAVLVGKLLGLPELRDKNLYLFDSYANDAALSSRSIQRLQINAMFGPGAYTRAERDHDAFVRFGMRLATDVDELADYTRWERDQFFRRRSEQAAMANRVYAA